jgi:enoyl-CoA hydratase/carnithine racemase
MNTFTTSKKLQMTLFKTLRKNFSSGSSGTSHSPLVTFELISNNKDIGLITIKNSKKRNALNLEILSSLVKEFENIETHFSQSKYPRVVIISSEGPVFSSGHDLKELNTFSEDKRQETFTKCSDVMMKIQSSSSIVIAEVQGLATAAGCQLAATCDLIVAASKAKFETPGVRIGLFCSSPSVALARAINPKRAMQMLVTGEQISAQKAQDWGLVNEIVEIPEGLSEEEQRKKLREKSLALAEHINQYSGQTLSFGKKTFYSQIGQGSLEGAYNIASNAMCTNLKFEDTQEGISAFLQKRKPNFNVCNTGINKNTENKH